MTTPDAWQALVTELGDIPGPVPNPFQTRALRRAVEQCADDARARGLAAEGMIKELRAAFARSSLSVTRETYLSSAASDDDDLLITKMVSWALTEFFVPRSRVAVHRDD